MTTLYYIIILYCKGSRTFRHGYFGAKINQRWAFWREEFSAPQVLIYNFKNTNKYNVDNIMLDKMN